MKRFLLKGRKPGMLLLGCFNIGSGLCVSVAYERFKSTLALTSINPRLGFPHSFLVRIDWKSSVSSLLSRSSTILLLVFPVELFHKDFSQHCRSPWSMARLSMCQQLSLACFISSRPHSWANGLCSSPHPLTRPISWAGRRSEEKHLMIFLLYGDKSD